MQHKDITCWKTHSTRNCTGVTLRRSSPMPVSRPLRVKTPRILSLRFFSRSCRTAVSQPSMRKSKQPGSGRLPATRWSIPTGAPVRRPQVSIEWLSEPLYEDDGSWRLSSSALKHEEYAQLYQRVASAARVATGTCCACASAMA